MKKIISLILVLSLLTLFSACSATDKNKVNISQAGHTAEKAVEKDDEVSVTVSFEDNPGIAAAILTVSYDTSCLLLTDVQYLNGYVNGGEMPEISYNPFKLSWCSLSNCTDTDFAVLTFKVTASSDTVTESKIDIIYEPGDICNIDEINVPLSVICDSVFIK